MGTKFWLMKSEPKTYSIDDLEGDGRTSWDGVRNYQARNFMRDDMQIGDLVLFYHSNAEPPGVAGIAQIRKEGYPDPNDPAWTLVDVAFVEKFSYFVSLDRLRQESSLQSMLVLKKGQRLSIQPVEKKHFEIVRKMGRNS